MVKVNLSTNKGWVYEILKKESDWFFIPLNTIFIIFFCYFLYLRACAVSKGKIKICIFILIGISVTPFAIFSLIYSIVSNPAYDFYPVVLKYIMFNSYVSEVIGFKFIYVDVFLVSVLTLMEGEQYSPPM